MVDRLVVWLYGTPVCALSSVDNYRMSLDWMTEGVERWGMGSRVLSVSLPLGSRIGARDNRPIDFFENLLPEGPAIVALARLAGVAPADTFGILAEFGRDCAGAVMVLPDGDVPPSAADAVYSPLSADELADAVRNLAIAPLGADPAVGFRPSLPGFQRKLLVARGPDGRWQTPGQGAPSTWILKPDGRTAMATNEIACLDLARLAGLPVPTTALLTVDGIPTVAIQRYDRTNGWDRIHQEDGCQAAGWKYEIEGGPSLRSLAQVLRDHGAADSVSDLLARVTFNVVVGNADAHAKNFSILHGPDGRTMDLAPVYDVISTVSLRATDDAGRQIPNDPRMGQKIHGILDINGVTRDDLVAEAISWGMRASAAAATVNDVLEAVSAAATTTSSGWLAELVAGRIAVVRGSRSPTAPVPSPISAVVED